MVHTTSHTQVAELAVEASIDGQEGLQEAQTGLYQQLGQQLKALWSNGQKTQEAPTEATELPPPPQPSTLLPGPQDRVPAVREGRAGLVQPQGAGWEVVQGEVARDQD